MNNFTLSIVSHGQAHMIENLLLQLDGNFSLLNVKVIITLNLNEDFNIKEYKNIKIIIIRNLIPKGFGANHNSAFEHCDTPWFGVLNPDLRLIYEEPFTKLLNSLDVDDAMVGVIAPRIINQLGAVEDSVRDNLTPWSILIRHIFPGHISASFKKSKDPRDFFWLAGMCLLINSFAFKAVNGFDERFFLYCEDYDLCARLHISGYLLKYNPNFSIIHNAQRKSHRSQRYLYWHLSSLIRVWISKPFWLITLFPLRILTRP